MPEYAGDKSLAWISFKTIDLMSCLEAAELFPPEMGTAIQESALALIGSGYVYPFASYYLARKGILPLLPNSVAAAYIRQTSPFDTQSSVWALLSSAKPEN